MSDHQQDQLTRTLRERSGDMTGSHLDLDQVKGRARGIQRRRRTAGALVTAAVVLAIGVPVGLNLGDLTNSQEPLPTTPSPDPTPSVVETPEQRPAPTPRADGSFPLTLTGLTVGQAPGLPYVLDEQRQLITPEGTVELPDSFLQITPFRSGWLGIVERRSGVGGVEVRVMDQDFTVRSTTPSGTTMMLSDGGRVAYSEDEGGDATLVSASTTGSDESRWSVPGQGGIEPVGFLDEETVLFQSTSGAQQYLGIAGPDGEVSQVEGFLNLRGTSQATGLVSGLTSFGDPGTCSAVADPRAGGQLWDTCDWTLGAFSPDGRHVVGYPADYDGLGPASMAILDAATGDLVTEFSPGRVRVVTAVSQAAWEDDDSLVVALSQGERQGFVRADVDGRLELVTDTITVPGLSVGIFLAVGPRF